MPFLRYDIGDHATWDRSTPHLCTCGAATPTLASIDGRTDDFILTPDGRRISPLIVLTTVLNACARVTPEGAHVGQVRQFQVVQESQGEVEVRIVPCGPLPPRLDDRMREEFGRLHQGFRIRISILDSIPSGPSGKLKRIVSRTER
jgi:phenylacetate-CoA ligase